MMISLYYIYTAFQNKSLLRSSISSIFAALCLSSAVMGKQYLYALAAAAILLLVFNIKKGFAKEDAAIAVSFTAVLVFAASPLLIYILYAGENYYIREKSLVNDFLTVLKNNGIEGIKPYMLYMKEVFLDPFSYRRMFLPGFTLIPLSYYFLVIPGLVISLAKKHFEILFLIFIPVAGAFISGIYDFRVLMIASPVVISMAFFLAYIFDDRQKKSACSIISCIITGVLLTAGLAPSISYIWKVSKNSNYFWLLPHKDVAVSRYIQDIVVGSNNPSINLKPDEFNRNIDTSSVNYDTFACPEGAYAIIHLYLQNHDGERVLSFVNGLTQKLLSTEELLKINTDVICSYEKTDKDLKLVWEKSEKVSRIIDIFRAFSKYGHEETVTLDCDGVNFKLYILTIFNENIDSFKNDIAAYLQKNHTRQ